MRSISMAGLLAFAFAMTMTTEASAWYCRATSSTGSSGWGTSPSISYAKQRALLECAYRTPRGRTCYVRSCR